MSPTRPDGVDLTLGMQLLLRQVLSFLLRLHCSVIFLRTGLPLSRSGGCASIANLRMCATLLQLFISSSAGSVRPAFCKNRDCVCPSSRRGASSLVHQILVVLFGVASSQRVSTAQEYGFDDASDVQFFNGDNFNEMSPRSRNSDYLATWGEAMFQPLAAESSGVNGSWFVQGWSLGGWPDADVSAYWSKVSNSVLCGECLRGSLDHQHGYRLTRQACFCKPSPLQVPAGRLLSLDLNCAMNGGTFKKFTDRLSPPRDVVCGLLENMGGRRALDGGLATLSRQSLQNANYSAYVSGLGWNPEDLHCNPIKWVRLLDCLVLWL